MFDEFYDRKRKRDALPDNSEFLQILLNLLGENVPANNYSISESELTRQLQIILQDEFTGEVHIKGNNILALCFTNGEQFNIQIVKNNLSDFFF